MKISSMNKHHCYGDDRNQVCYFTLVWSAGDEYDQNIRYKIWFNLYETDKPVPVQDVKSARY
jgi:hypothetical protein